MSMSKITEQFSTYHNNEACDCLSGSTTFENNVDTERPFLHVIYDPTKNTRFRTLIKTGNIKLTSHGIPQFVKQRYEDNYFSNDDTREFIKIPLEPNPSIELMKQMKALDDWTELEKTRKKLFNNQVKKYKYHRTIKRPYKTRN
ncbi:hypothetical protein QJ856_gp0968 [Tupanvirus deep ocean]|uniref:Uncharacterized protein n=2 Tax=Tupanvirus TaxID=2094720 RepID=A0AC62A7T5_9VIRU|nr:hypothetical protein QJ856_gp0968 [Tupanvirus deep ocean]QKU33789.1 hypothetical protein [Tupanvirus deep ocean]